MIATVQTWLDRLSVAQRFMLGSLAILALGMAGVGAWVTQQIEDGVVHRTAATTALYVDSLITPLLQDLATGDSLSQESVDRLDWLLDDTPLGREVALFKVLDRSGRIVYSNAPSMAEQILPVERELANALAGGISADIGKAEGGGTLPADVSGRDLIEIYSPVRSRGTSDVIAVAEFYYATSELEGDLAAAQRRSWLVVGRATLGIYFLLATFIQRVSNTVRRQQQALREQVTRLTDVLSQNKELHSRVQGAAARTAALNERFLRRFSAELHDGPAQDVSLALLRLDHVAASCGTCGDDAAATERIERELELIQSSLARALNEVRGLSSGILLPHLGILGVAKTLDHVLRGHRRRTGSPVNVALNNLPEDAPLATKIALYRIVQEALTNSWRHADRAGLTVTVVGLDNRIQVEVKDLGPGFDPLHREGFEAHLGLVGMRERAESLGGQFHIESAPGQGATVIATLPLENTGGLDG